MAWIVLLLSLVGFMLLADKFINVPHDPKEPPLIPPTIPWIGHLLGMLRDGSRYYNKISVKFPIPIYTLGVPRGKIYIVNSPSLVAAVDRSTKTISFAPYVVQFAKRLLLPSEKGLDALAENLHQENGLVGCRLETIEAMHSALAPGEDLDRTTQDMLQSVSRLLESVYTISDNEDFDLFSWVKKVVTRASTDAIYGASKNPFQDPAVENGFWDIDKNFALLGLKISPKLLTPRGYRGRATLFQAFHKYYALDGYKSGSRLVQARYEVNQKYDLPMEDIEHFDLSVCIGLLVNTVPSTAWALYYIYSQPSLLNELRDSMSPYVCISPDASSNDLKRTVNIANIVQGVPLLSSLVREILRVQSTNASGRVVLRDTLLEDRYLLKDSILLIPSAGLHHDASVWGPSCKDFDPRRFMMRKRADGGAIHTPASAFRAYGGGASVCSGRYLAANEIAIIVVIMVLRYDLSPSDGGTWVMPRSRPHITTSILTPVGKVKVRVSKRNGHERGDWRFCWIN